MTATAAPVQLGADAEIDKLAILGEIPGRQIDDLRLVIGEHARVRSFSVIYAGSTIGSHLETGHHVVIREQNRIGDRVKVWNHSTIDFGCLIGDGVRIHNHVYVAQYTVIEDDVFLAPGVMIANDKYPVRFVGLKGPTIRRGARVGINATLMPEVIVGEGSVVGAGAVVTKDVPPGAVVVGNPARVIGRAGDLNRAVKAAAVQGTQS